MEKASRFETALMRIREHMPFLETSAFGGWSWVASIFGSLPLCIQTIKAATAPSVEGIAIEAYVTLSVFHGTMVLNAIRRADPRSFILFSLTAIFGASIASIAFFRGGAFMLF